MLQILEDSSYDRGIENVLAFQLLFCPLVKFHVKTLRVFCNVLHTSCQSSEVLNA